jgi:hypothetical protein
MNMTDHWNFAIEGARGEYVSIFNEKFFLRKDALQVIYNTYESHKPDLISWNYEWLGDPVFAHGEITGGYHPMTAPSEAKEFSSSEHLSNYFDIKYPLMGNNKRDFIESRYGRIYGGCVRKSVIRKVIDKYGKVFFPISPDYTSQYLFLNETDAGIHIGQCLMLHVVFKAVSNGMKAGTDITQVITFLNEYGMDIDSYMKEGPIPGFYSGLTYAVIRDLYLLKKLVFEGVIKEKELNIAALCFYAKKDLDVLEGLDLAQRLEQEKILDTVITNFTEQQKQYYGTMEKRACDKKNNKWPNFLYASNFTHLAMKKSHQFLFDLSAQELAKLHWCDNVMLPVHKSIFSQPVTLSQAVDYMHDYNFYSCQFLGIK